MPSLHDCVVKMPNFKFNGDVNQRRIFLSLSKLECVPQEINSREIRLQLAFSVNWSERDKVGKNANSIVKIRDVLAAVVVVDARVPQ